MADLPTGTVTFLFTDVEGSTRLLHELGPEAYGAALLEHRRVLRTCFSGRGGVEVDTQGDAFFYAFADAAAAVRAAGEAQAGLGAGPISVRIGVHTGRPLLTDEGYVGEDVHLGARVAAAGHGGQVLLSVESRNALGPGNDVVLRELGEHRLKDFDDPVRLFQLGAGDFPPLKTLNNTNLPVPGSSFVGRERERAEVASLLRSAGGRLVTLTGPGGSGKTRLAIEAASDAVGEYLDGVFWVGLAGLREPALVVETIAQTLGAQGTLAEHIGGRTMLLLLDNFEQLVEAAPELSALLAACGTLRLLVTSRELLRIQGEVEYQVPPLEKSEAEELFCARSRLPLDDEIADLCRHLDDLPLALELAAARTAVLSPAQIAERLSHRLDLFRGTRDADPRQQTLRATIEWSYELLDEPERLLFACLSVFAGGCTFEAAEEIAGADLDTIQSLVDKSLVRRTGARFWMLETIGELARERLEESDEAEEIGRRHAEWFLALAEHAEPFLTGAEQPVWLQRLEDDHDNLRKSLDWSFEHEPELGVRLAGALWLFWYTHGHVSEARRWLRRALDVAPDEPSESRAKVLGGAGYLASEQGDVDEAIVLLEEALSYAKGAGATGAAASTAAMLCAIRADAPDRDSDPEPVLAMGEEAVALAREAGDDFVLALALNNLGSATMSLLGDDELATAYFEESLELRRRIGDPSRIAASQSNVAAMAFVHGDVGRAAALWAEAAEIAAAIGDRRHLCFAHSGLAWVAIRKQRWEEAEARARESLGIAHEIGMKAVIVDELRCLAGIAAASGDTARAARLAAVAELHHSFLVSDVDVFAELCRAEIERVKAACDPEDWKRAWAEGSAMSLDEAAEYALS